MDNARREEVACDDADKENVASVCHSGRWNPLRAPATAPHTLALLFVVVLVLQTFAQTEAICPARCQCTDEGLRVLCVNTGLEYVPIQLNPELQQLNLTKNKISHVHYTLIFYNTLEILDLSYNKIQTLGSSNFESQHHLLYLNLSNNNVSNLSKDTFKGLKQLEELDLSFNLLTNITSSAFWDLKSLKVFYLNNNYLISFEPGLFRHVTKLRKFVLNWNQLLEVPEDILTWTKNIERLELSHNLIEQIGDSAIVGLSALQHLAFDSNVISEISSGAFDELPALQYLDLSDNNLTSVPTQQMSKLSNLTILNLSGNFIEQIEALAFRSLFQLRNLFLNRLDRLTSIDARAFVDNVNLEKVWIESDPQLTRIPTRMFHGSSRVSHISLRDNALRTLEPAHFPLDQLTSLKLSGTNFVCNCSIVWLWKLLKEDERIWSTRKNTSGNRNGEFELYLEANGVVCSSPIELAGRILREVNESDIGCSTDWTTTLIGIALVCFVIAVIASVVVYLKWLRCLPERRMTGGGHGRARGLGHGHNPRCNIDLTAALYDHPHNHHPHAQPHGQTHGVNHKGNVMISPWNISYHEEFPRNDYPSSASLHAKQKPPHIVFV